FSLSPAVAADREKQHQTALKFTQTYCAGEKSDPCTELRRAAESLRTYDFQVCPVRYNFTHNLRTGVPHTNAFYKKIKASFPHSHKTFLCSIGFSTLNTHRLRPDHVPGIIALLQEMEIWYYSLGKKEKNKALDTLRTASHTRLKQYFVQQEKYFLAALSEPYNFMISNLHSS
ncbi:MAG: hypothetical protein Q7K43_06025, partial [Candidatus Woesearchaeota archaeon]|nr:hypothetical protein [Candidatus Woesearchaeota archaeon]